MATKSKIRKGDALTVLAAVRTRFGITAADQYGPVLAENFTWVGSAPYAIVWEEGPFEWAMAFTGGGISEEDAEMCAELNAEFGADLKPAGHPAYEAPAGVYVEPLTGWALGLYPA